MADYARLRPSVFVSARAAALYLAGMNPRWAVVPVCLLWSAIAFLGGFVLGGLPLAALTGMIMQTDEPSAGPTLVVAGAIAAAVFETLRRRMSRSPPDVQTRAMLLVPIATALPLLMMAVFVPVVSCIEVPVDDLWGLPCVALLAAGLWVPGFVILGDRFAVRHAQGRCMACGYDLSGLPERRCPECGAAEPRG